MFAKQKKHKNLCVINIWEYPVGIFMYLKLTGLQYIADRKTTTEKKHFHAYHRNIHQAVIN